ncbi:homogentisate 1,2-dioxygenase domain-containing protein, partial [Streptomyces albidoflavus]
TDLLWAPAPERYTFEMVWGAVGGPKKIDDGLAFMFETRWPILPTAQAAGAAHRQQGYDGVWQGLERHWGTAG